MEEMLLRVCVIVVSLLYIKDNTVHQDQEENIIMDMQEREYLLQKEMAKLKQEMHQVTAELPHSNQEVSQSHRRLKNEEGDDSAVQVENPAEHQHIQDKTVPHPDSVPSEVQHEVTEDVDLPSAIGVQPDLVESSQNKMKNVHVEDKKETSDNDQKADEAKTKEDQGNSYSNGLHSIDPKSSNFDQVEGMLNQMPREDNPHREVMKSTEGTTEENSTASNQQTTENPYNWFLWKLISIISLIRFLKKYISKGSRSSGTINPIKRKTTCRATGIFSQICIPDQVVSDFYDQCVKIPQSTHDRVCEFVESFVDELLEAARKASNKETDMHIGNFIGVGSVYERWATGKTMVCDLYVPITAPESHRFDVELWKKKDALLSGLGKIKMVNVENTSNGCPCMNGNPDEEDTLCLLHLQRETSKAVINKALSSLCQENTPYLSKKQVVTWFRTMISKAWGEISHKYEFELRFHSRMAPGALRVRFRSGKVILFNITPVVQVESSEVYLVSYLSTNQNTSDVLWPISFASYENALIQYFSKTLPYKSCHIECLQILSFLHKQQMCLTGKCGLTNHHLKSTLLHLLMYNLSEWKHEQLISRLTDMLVFLEQRLLAKELHHALVGNSLVPKDIGLPKEFQIANPINLFLPMVSDEECYKKTVNHFQELVKNAPVLIQEYVSIKRTSQRK